MMDALCHSTSIAIERSARDVHAFLSDPGRLDRWSFGTRETTLHAGGLIEGRSIFDGRTTWVRIEAGQDAGIIRYWLGPNPEALAPRIVAHVIPGERLGRAAETSVLTLLAWRSAEMSEERWRRLTASHEFEVNLIKALVEGERA